MLHDRIALKNHSYVATRAERIRNSEHWILKLNQDGAQRPLNERPDLAPAKRECKRLHDEQNARTQQEKRTIPRSQQVRQRKGQAFEGIEEYAYTVGHRTGWRFYEQQQGDFVAFVLANNWDRDSWTTRSWNSSHSSRSDNSWTFSQFETSFGSPGDKLPDNRRCLCTETPLTYHVWARTVHLHSLLTCTFTHHANTCGSRAHSSGLHALVSWKDSVIHASCLVPCRTRDWPLAHALSPTSRIFQRFSPSQSCPWYWMNTPAQIHGGVADPVKSHLPQVRSPCFPTCPTSSSPTPLSLEESSWTGILGQI